jgi:protein SCO1/2
VALASCLFGAADAGGQPLLDDIGLDQKLDAALPLDLSFRDEEGRSIALADLLRGRPVVLSFVYHRCPMLCPELLDGLLRSLRALSISVGSEFDVWAVSIDPEEDSRVVREKKSFYLERYGRAGAASGWHFLTGDRESTRRLTAAAGYRYVEGEGGRGAAAQFAHPSGLLVLTPQGRISRYFYGIDFAPRDLGFALMEAADSRIGSAVDRILLYCHRYDPATGRYGIAVLSVLRLLALATLLSLGSFVGLSVLRERRALRSS